MTDAPHALAAGTSSPLGAMPRREGVNFSVSI